MKIKRCIFQGDSLSPLLFCLPIDPLSGLLSSKVHFESKRASSPKKFSHLLYMDDLKLYASPENMLKSQLNTVKDFLTDITKKFRLDKCETVTTEKGKLLK